MCGIVGSISKKNVVPFLMDGLKSLEYRGYDSSGVAVLKKREIEVKRRLGKLSKLETALKKEPLQGKLGLGHTRWATHGKPSERNAHPHRAGDVVVVHNGIIENSEDLKARLAEKGHRFKSETDTEVIAHLIEDYIKEGHELPEAVSMAVVQLKGSYAIGVFSGKDPEILVAAKDGSPMIIGLANDGNCLASDIPALLPVTKRVIILEDRQIAVLSRKDVLIQTREGEAVTPMVRTVQWSPMMMEKGGYKHFMLKEIHEQPRAVIETITGRVSKTTGAVQIKELKLSSKELNAFKRIYIVACGTSWHAAMVGKYMMEEYCRIPVEVDLGSEFRYRNPILGEDTLLVLISQSGETADTLAALKEGMEKGARIVSICNVVDSSLARKSHGVLYTHAGPEIGVASTKAFTSQLIALCLMAIYFGKMRGALPDKDRKKIVTALVRIPLQMEEILNREGEIKTLAKKYFHHRDFLYLGRGVQYPLALEGALKLKEISYIHAEGYAAGEMKHGPIALIDENMPVVVITTKSSHYEKVLSNIEQVKAREGKVIAIISEEDTEIRGKVDDFFWVPGSLPFLEPLLTALPLQLLAYYIADLKGTDVDQPRNLAKSVTVE